MKPKDQELEQLLDQMLAESGKAEPRFGLENRVLASLEAEKVRITGQRRWWWALGTAAVTALVAAGVWMGYPDRRAQSQAEGNPVRITSAPATTAKEVVPSVNSAPAIRRSRSRRVVIRPPADDQVAGQAPKLEQFPSPAPLSEQERILARYVRQYPEHAVLIARAQTALEQQDQQEELQRTLEGSSSRDQRSEN